MKCLLLYLHKTHNFMSYHFSTFPFQDEASWIGVYVTAGGVFMAILASRFSDILFGYMKLTIISLMVVATAGYTWFLLLMNECLPFSKGERERALLHMKKYFLAFFAA